MMEIIHCFTFFFSFLFTIAFLGGSAGSFLFIFSSFYLFIRTSCHLSLFFFASGDGAQTQSHLGRREHGVHFSLCDIALSRFMFYVLCFFFFHFLFYSFISFLSFWMHVSFPFVFGFFSTQLLGFREFLFIFLASLAGSGLEGPQQALLFLCPAALPFLSFFLMYILFVFLSVYSWIAIHKRCPRTMFERYTFVDVKIKIQLNIF